MAEKIAGTLISIFDKDLVLCFSRGKAVYEIPRTFDWKRNEDKFKLDGYIDIDIDILYFCTSLLKTKEGKEL